MRYFFVLLFMSSLISSCQKLQEVDLIIDQAQIYTVDDEFSIAEAMAIKDGKFIAIGSSDEVEATKGPNTEIVDLKGQFVMPGIGDAHIHPALLMPKRAFCALPGTFYEPTEEEI